MMEGTNALGDEQTQGQPTNASGQALDYLRLLLDCRELLGTILDSVAKKVTS